MSRKLLPYGQLFFVGSLPGKQPEISITFIPIPKGSFLPISSKVLPYLNITDYNDNYNNISIEIGDEYMKKIRMGFLISIIVILAACSNDSDKDSGEKDISQPSNSSKVEPVEPVESENLIEDEKEPEVEKEKKSSEENTHAVASGENLLTEDLVFEYEEGDIVMTIDHAEFTREFTTSTGEDTRDENLDSKILLHLQGKINNDSVESFSYGHQLGQVKFKFVYDDKHEFDTYAATESLDGSKFEGANIDPLQEQIIHIYAAVPLPVSERDNSLVLIITDSDGDHEVVLR